MTALQTASAAAYLTARDALLAERVPAGHWVGELSTSALSTATAVMALHLVNPFEHRDRIDAGIEVARRPPERRRRLGRHDQELLEHLHDDALPRRASADRRREGLPSRGREGRGVPERRVRATSPEQRAEAIRRRYGKDRTFSVPILMTCALAGLVPWKEVPRLPFEVACLPQSWYRFARLPVVSYALPALIAIGQCVHHHRGTWNPLAKPLRWLAKGRTLEVLRRIQPTSGGYLEATPLTSFVVMALASIRRRRRPPSSR